MNLNWYREKDVCQFEVMAGATAERVEHFFALEDGSEDVVKKAVLSSIDKAISLFGENITEKSRYFLLEWDIPAATLTIVVTNETKKEDAPNVVKCHMAGLTKAMAAMDHLTEADSANKTGDMAENISDWTYDYLTTCDKFIGSSLVVLFHCESRAQARAL